MVVYLKVNNFRVNVSHNNDINKVFGVYPVRRRLFQNILKGFSTLTRGGYWPRQYPK